MTINKYILVYGATGLVGKELVAYLIYKSYNVVVLARNKDKAEKLFGSKVFVVGTVQELIRLNIEEKKSCLGIVNLVGANLGAKFWSRAYKKQILKSRTDSIKYLKEFVKQVDEKPKVWVQASAVGYYGANVIKPTDEVGEKGEGFLSDVVEKWEHSLETINLPNTRKVFLRFGVVITRKGGFLKKMIDTANLGLVVLPNVDEQKLAFIHIYDLLALIETVILSNYIKGKINAVASQVLKMEDLGLLLKNNTRAKFSIKLPSFLFQLMLGKQKANELVLANQYIVSSVLPINNHKFRFEKPEQFFDRPEK